MIHAQTNGGHFRDAHEVLHYLGGDLSRMIKAIVENTNMADVVLATADGEIEMTVECDADNTHVLTLSADGKGSRRLVITLAIVEDNADDFIAGIRMPAEFPADVVAALGRLGVKVS